jgi:hypothetical protein
LIVHNATVQALKRRKPLNLDGRGMLCIKLYILLSQKKAKLALH